VALSPPWYWWRLKLRPCPDGALVHQSYDDPVNVTEYSLMFDLLEDVEIHDPPAMHLTHFAPEYDYPYGDPYRPLRALMASGPEGVVDVVWYKRPGPMWHQLPGNTCCPGDYQISMESDRRDRREDDAQRCLYMQDMPALRWDQVATDDASAEGRRIAAAFGLPGPMIGQTTPPRTLDEHCQDIWDAIRNYESQMARRPSAVLMNEQDYRELRRLGQQADLDRGLYQPGPLYNRPFDTILGMEIRAERAVPRGQYIVVNDRTGYDPINWGNPAREPGRGYTLSDINELRGGFHAAGGMGILTPNQIREREGLPPYAGWQPSAQSSNLLNPEDGVLDEIDQLVNESIAPGPRDDYNADRYVKCQECWHDWHGLECSVSRCDCINTDWLSAN
jgi:hypothetical protein